MTRAALELAKLSFFSAVVSGLLLPAYALAGAAGADPWTSAAQFAFPLNFTIIFAALLLLDRLSGGGQCSE
jgi:hypothetical protein